MTTFNFIDLNKSIEINIKTANIKPSAADLNVLRSYHSTPSTVVRKTIEPIKNSVFKKMELVNRLYQYLTQTIYYLEQNDFLSLLPEQINIELYKTSIIDNPFRKSKLKEKENLQALADFSNLIPTIGFSTELLGPRSKHNSFIDYCKSAFNMQDNRVIENAFFHELGHVFSMSSHKNKNLNHYGVNTPIMDSIKINYEESFADAFGIYMLKFKYPKNEGNFIGLLQRGRQDFLKLTYSKSEMNHYNLHRLHDMVQPLQGSPTIEDILSYVEKGAKKNIEHNLTDLLAIEGIHSKIVKELNLSGNATLSPLQIIDFLHTNLNTTQANNQNIKNKIFKFREEHSTQRSVSMVKNNDLNKLPHHFPLS